MGEKIVSVKKMGGKSEICIIDVLRYVSLVWMRILNWESNDTLFYVPREYKIVW